MREQQLLRSQMELAYKTGDRKKVGGGRLSNHMRQPWFAAVLGNASGHCRHCMACFIAQPAACA